jgi:copper chaperone NosL
MMSRGSRFLVAAGALLMLLAYVTPLWRIELIAPQYPEGLGLRIWVTEVRGARPPDLNSVNNLNHYIGMKRIENDTIPELRFMPWILGGLILTGLGAAAVGRRQAVAGWLIGASAVALAGLADFWKWGYDYGHELDPAAIIKIPGMSYQPPLLGSKQLLNFYATSWPDVGGWAIVLALGFALAALVLDHRRRKAITVAALGAIAACTPGPRPFRLGEDACQHCHMPIADLRFAGQLVTRTGKVYTFDDIGCLAAFVTYGPVAAEDVHGIHVNAFSTPGSMLDAASATYLRTDALRTPMASGLAAFPSRADAEQAREEFGGELLTWSGVLAGEPAPAASP